MRIFALHSRAFIENSIKDFANPEQQAIWSEFAVSHPQVRRTNDDPEDDGAGPMPGSIQSLITDVLRKRIDHVMNQIRSPLITPNEAAILSGDAGTAFAIARSLSDPTSK